MPTQLLEAGLTICAPKVFGEQSNLTFGGGGTHTRRQRRNASPDGGDTTRQAAGRHASPGGGAAPRLGAARCVNLLRRHQASSSGGLTAAEAPPCLAAVPRLAPAQRLAWRSARPGGGGTPRPVAGHGLPGGMDGTPRPWTEALRLRHGRHYGCGNTPRPGAAARLAQRWRCHASPGNSGATPRRAAATDLARLQQAPPIGGSPGGSDTPCREAAARLARRRRCHASPGGGVNASPCGNATVRWAANRLDEPSRCKIGPGAGRPTGSRRLQ